MNIEARGEGCGDCLGLILWLTLVTSFLGKAFVYTPLGQLGKFQVGWSIGVSKAKYRGQVNMRMAGPIHTVISEVSTYE